MKPIVHSVILSLVLSIAAAGQAPQQPAEKPAAALPTVDQILDRYVEALGGKAAMEKLNTRVSKGSFEAAQGGSGSVEIYAKAPNKNALIVDVEGMGQFRQGFDGTVGWTDNAQAGLREMEGQELSVTRRSAVFHGPLKLRELYPQMTLKGMQKVGERDAYLIEADPGDGSLRRMYFDARTGLLLRNEIERDTPQGRATFQTDLEDYKEVDGVKIPFTVRQANPNLTLVVKLSEVRHNVPVDDAKFAKPAAQ